MPILSMSSGIYPKMSAKVPVMHVIQQALPKDPMRCSKFSFSQYFYYLGFLHHAFFFWSLNFLCFYNNKITV